MGKVQQIEDQVSKLSPQELERFRTWYSKFDADEWDRLIERDAAAGNLDRLAEDALKAHTAGNVTAL